MLQVWQENEPPDFGDFCLDFSLVAGVVAPFLEGCGVAVWPPTFLPSKAYKQKIGNHVKGAEFSKIFSENYWFQSSHRKMHISRKIIDSNHVTTKGVTYLRGQRDETIDMELNTHEKRVKLLQT